MPPTQQVAVDPVARAAAAEVRLGLAEAVGRIDAVRQMAVTHDRNDEARSARIQTDIDRLILAVENQRAEFGGKIDGLSKDFSEATGRVHGRIDALVKAALFGACGTVAVLISAILYETWRRAGGTP